MYTLKTTIPAITILIFPQSCIITNKETSIPTNPETIIDPSTENSIVLCTDGEDNDNDYLIDCDDPCCQMFALCFSL